MSKTSPTDAKLPDASDPISHGKAVRLAWTYAVHVSLFLLIMSLFVVLGAAAEVAPDKRTVSVALGTLEPAIASLVMLILALVYPAVYFGTTMKFPHTVSLPVLFVTLLGVIHLFGVATPGRLQRFEGIARLDQLWSQPLVLLFLAVGQIVVLSLYSSHKHRPRRETSA